MMYSKLENKQILTTEKELDYFMHYNNGEMFYKEEIMLNNIRLVYHIANYYSKNNYYSNLEFDDLVQEGILGLIEAVDKFDISKGNKFSTYAVWWIKHYINKAILDNSKTIRIPVQRQRKNIKRKKIEEELVNELGKIPTVDEINRKLEEENILIDNNEYYSYLNVKNSISLDEDIELNNGDTVSILETIEDTTFSTNMDILFVTELLNNILSIENGFSEKEIEIYRKVNGFDGERISLTACGELYNLSRGRIYNICVTVERKLSVFKSELELEGLTYQDLIEPFQKVKKQ